jgi:hypothetical protein
LIRIVPDSGFNLIGIKVISQTIRLVAKNLRLEGTSAFRSRRRRMIAPGDSIEGMRIRSAQHPILGACRPSVAFRGGRCRTVFRARTHRRAAGVVAGISPKQNVRFSPAVFAGDKHDHENHGRHLRTGAAATSRTSCSARRCPKPWNCAEPLCGAIAGGFFTAQRRGPMSFF